MRHWKRNCHLYLAELTKNKASASGTSGIFTIELFSFPKSNSWIYDTSCSTHICNTIQGLRGYRKLNKRALDLYVGNGNTADVEAIGSYELILPSGMILILDNSLDEGFFSKNYVRKFLRALHPKGRAKVMAIKESKDLSSLALDELICNLNVHEVVMEKDSEIYRGKKERVKSMASNSKNDAEDKTNDETCLMAQSSNEVCLRMCLEPDEWIKDSGCSKHMTGNKSLFSTYKAYDEVESLYVTFDESPPPTKSSRLVNDDVGEEEAIKNYTKVVNNNNKEDESIELDEVVKHYG
ncbi:hypothetical protein Tco_0265262 [Tanacetum coccineum]